MVNAGEGRRDGAYVAVYRCLYLYQRQGVCIVAKA